MGLVLQLYEKVIRGSTEGALNITSVARDTWSRSIRAVGGFWQGDFDVRLDKSSRIDLIELYNLSIGKRIVERTHGIVTWEGEIVQMDLTLDGITYRRTLDLERWHNKVQVAYTDAVTDVAAATAWSADSGKSASSRDTYGVCEYIDVVGSGYSAAIAAAARDTRVDENAYPKSVPVGGLAFSRGRRRKADSLKVYCSGYAFSINRLYTTGDVAAAAISSQLSTLVATSEFVTAGRIDANSDTAPIHCSDIAGRTWDVMENLVLMGDTSGNRWVGGVCAGRKFNYNLAETAVTHYWRGGQLLDKASVPVVASMIEPDIIVQVSGSPVGSVPPGGAVADNPRNVWIEEVEFIAPDGYRLTPYGGGFEFLEGGFLETG